ncbi:MAG: glycosyltransferase family 39 protein, partial [Armatimonadetes bacterium]|nr:glycosyltransferase family 39 protein [Armatimonadota bacterium]
MTDAEKDSSGPRDLLQARPSRRATVVWTLLFFVVAFGIRLSGIGWGLPTEYRHQSLHPDEPLIKMHADDKPYFRPGFYSYGTSYLTFLKVAADAGRAYGWVRHGDDVPDWQTDRDIHLTGRVLSAIAGAATVVVVFLLLLRLTGLLGAGLGAMAMALAPGHVVHSQFQTTDVFATLLIALSAWLIVRFLDADALRPELSVAGLGIVAGLAAGTKYSGAVMILPAFAAIYLKARPQFFRLSVPLCAAFLLGFVVATPGILLEPAAFWDGFTYEVRHAAEGHGLVFVQTPSGFI